MGVNWVDGEETAVWMYCMREKINKKKKERKQAE